MFLCCGEDGTPGGAPAHPGGLRCRVDGDFIEPAGLDEDGAVGEGGDPVAGGLDGDGQILGVGVANCLCHVCDGSRLHHHGGPVVEVEVPGGPGPVVVRVPGGDGGALEAGAERSQGVGHGHGRFSSESRDAGPTRVTRHLEPG